MNDDGTMARLDDLIPFAQTHGLKIGTIADLIAYRRKHDSIVSMTQETTIESVFGGEFKLKIYSNTVEPPSMWRSSRVTSTMASGAGSHACGIRLDGYSRNRNQGTQAIPGPEVHGNDR